MVCIGNPGKSVGYDGEFIISIIGPDDGMLFCIRHSHFLTEIFHELSDCSVTIFLLSFDSTSNDSIMNHQKRGDLWDFGEC
ncbi:hypothetical protein GCM10011328_23830 [Hafnia psychrotolerans]|uniref:Uncharacterized protein n=1 Tax=Hafnia psychrotolerans TaxID=1477018 RepID=A0ABQ1GPH9_9GAMM|nr:hypothetical protein GCM10011328_23830 [Hafnia psychrotolerans]